MRPEDIIERLRIRYGNHSAAAREMGVDARTYRRWRSAGRLPEFVHRYLEMKLKEKPPSDLSEPQKLAAGGCSAAEQ